MADLGKVGSLPSGVIVAVVDPTATTTGTTKSYEFTIEGSPVNRDHTLTLAAQGASAVPTTVTSNLEASYDGGTTWQIYSATIALVAGGVATAAKVLNVVTGPLYRLNQTTVSIGSAVTFTVYACVN